MLLKIDMRELRLRALESGPGRLVVDAGRGRAAGRREAGGAGAAVARACTGSRRT